MAADKLPDPETPFGTMVRERLVSDTLIWLTTVGKDGTPQPNPVWFLLDEGEILIYNTPKANRIKHIAQRPSVALNLNAAEGGDGIVVITGLARVVPDAPLATGHPAYLAKYEQLAAEVSGDVEKFAADYSVAIRVEITKVRGF